MEDQKVCPSLAADLWDLLYVSKSSDTHDCIIDGYIGRRESALYAVLQGHTHMESGMICLIAKAVCERGLIRANKARIMPRA